MQKENQNKALRHITERAASSGSWVKPREVRVSYSEELREWSRNALTLWSFGDVRNNEQKVICLSEGQVLSSRTEL